MELDHKGFVSARWRELLRWDELPDDIQEQIGRYGRQLFALGGHDMSRISEIKYEGRLIVLEDGTRWEVDSSDVGTAELWQSLSKVVIIDREMFNIEDAKKVTVKVQA